MRNFLFILVAALFSNPSMGQFVVPKYGKVSPEELAMKVYPKDSTAEAVFLFDEGRGAISYQGISEKWVLQFRRHGRIKILTKDGLDQANIVIQLYSGEGRFQRLSDFDAVVFNLEGGTVVKSKVNNDDFITEEVTRGLTERKIAIPDCKVGSVIDFQYIINSDYLFNFYSWEFQQTIPVIYSQYSVSIPEYFNYNTVSAGYEYVAVVDASSRNERVTITYQEKNEGLVGSGNVKYNYDINYQLNEKTYIAQDVPGLSEDEAWVDNIYNYQTRLDFELAQVNYPHSPLQTFSTTWEKTIETLLTEDDFGGQLNGGSYMDDLLPNIVVGTTPEEKMVAVFGFIRSSIKWNSRFGLFVKDGVRKALKDGVGNSAEVNLNLVIALRKAGLSAFPVAISTRENGIVNQSRPTLTGFNHVIAVVFVAEKAYLLDATSRFSTINILPFQDLNGVGRIVDVNRNKWISLEPLIVSQLRSVGTFTILMDGSIRGTLQQAYNEYLASSLEINYGNDFSEKFEAFIKKGFNSETVDSLKIVFEEKGRPKVAISALIKPEGVISISGDHLYIDPCVGFGNLLNPFLTIDRKFPVNFGMPQEESYMNIFVIPTGYMAEELPAQIAISLPNSAGKFTYSCSLNGGRLMVITRLSISKSVFSSADYIFLKSFFDQIVAKQNQKVILKKI